MIGFYSSLSRLPVKAVFSIATQRADQTTRLCFVVAMTRQICALNGIVIVLVRKLELRHSKPGWAELFEALTYGNRFAALEHRGSAWVFAWIFDADAGHVNSVDTLTAEKLGYRLTLEPRGGWDSEVWDFGKVTISVHLSQ